MSNIITYQNIIIFTITYLISSIPFGMVFCYLAGYGDIRKIGSKNIGATNVYRTGNKLLALLTLICDSGKGAFSTIIAILITNDYIISAWVGVIAVIGHNFPIYLKFKGGKGIATTLGTLLVINPIIATICIINWIIIFAIFRISSLSSLVALGIVPLYTYFIDKSLIIPISILSILSFIRHKNNIIRLIYNKENKI